MPPQKIYSNIPYLNSRSIEFNDGAKYPDAAVICIKTIAAAPGGEEILYRCSNISVCV
jgi:hypothetical protein